MDEMRFDDDVVIVTGAGRGLGREHALAFAARGAAVVVNNIAEQNGSAADAVVDEIRNDGGRAAVAVGSVAEPDSAMRIVEAAVSEFGKVTVLINNAGVIDFAKVTGLTETAWRRMMAITLDGTFFITRAVWPHFLDQGYGRIVNTTSNAGFAGNETLAHYGAAKLGVAGFTRALSQEAKGTGIGVNAIAPMAVTRMNRDVFFGGASAEGEDWRQDITDGRVPMGPPSIVSPTVVWLAHRSTEFSGEIFHLVW